MWPPAVFFDQWGHNEKQKQIRAFNILFLFQTPPPAVRHRHGLRGDGFAGNTAADLLRAFLDLEAAGMVRLTSHGYLAMSPNAQDHRADAGKDTK